MPEELHSQTGLRIIRNDANRFIICTLHYTADPVKRTKEWQVDAKAGMRPAQWAKEYEIDYVALYGQRVFPEISANRDRIVVQEPYPEWSAMQPFWGGFDFGQRNPTSFHVYTISDGVLYSVWEHYEPCKNIPDLCQKLLSCPYYYQIKYIACDPTITNRRTQTNRLGNFITLSDLMMEYGVKKLIPGNTDETTWLEMVRQHWKDAADPTFRIFARCPAMIKEFENAVFAGQSDKEILTETYKEKIEDVHNHALDDSKYLMLSRPSLRNLTPQRDPEMWRRWLK